MVLNILQYLNFVQAFLWLSRVVLCHFCRIHAACSNIVNLVDVAENSSSKMFLEADCARWRTVCHRGRTALGVQVVSWTHQLSGYGVDFKSTMRWLSGAPALRILLRCVYVRGNASLSAACKFPRIHHHCQTIDWYQYYYTTIYI